MDDNRLVPDNRNDKRKEFPNVSDNSIIRFMKKISNYTVPFMVLCGYFAFLLIFDANSICLFKNVFLVPCAGCGMTRAFLHIITGDLAGAFYYNALSIPLFLFGVVSFLWIVRDVIKGDSTYKLFMTRPIPKWAIFLVATITILNWLLNIIRGV